MKSVFLFLFFSLFLSCSSTPVLDAQTQEYLKQFSNHKESLKVDYYFPTGPININQRQFVLHFSQPMVKLSDIGQVLSEIDFVKISPEVSGKFKWINSRTLLFEPTTDLKSSSRYQMSIAAGTESLLGYGLLKEFSFDFLTSASIVEQKSTSSKIAKSIEKNQTASDAEPDFLPHELVLVPMLPSFIRYGDSLDGELLITNNQPENMIVDLTIQSEPSLVEPLSKQSIVIPSLQTVTVPLKILANSPELKTFLWENQKQDFSKTQQVNIRFAISSPTYQDFKDVTLPIYLDLPQKVASKSGEVQTQSQVPFEKESQLDETLSYLDVFLQTNPVLMSDVMAKMSLNDQHLLSFQLTAAEPTQNLFIPANQLPKKMVFSLVKDLGKYLYFKMDWHSVFQDWTSFGEEQGMTLSREVFNTQGKKTNLQSLKRGERYQIKLSLFVEKPCEHLVLTENLPAGFGWLGSDVLNLKSYLKYQQVNPESLVLLAENVQPGFYQFAYQIEAVYAGEFLLPPSKVRDENDAQVFGTTKKEVVDIR